MLPDPHVPLAPRSVFVSRLVQATGLAVAVVAVGLGIGVAGYRWIAGLPWVDAFLNASMILGGMGPVAELHSDASKIFAACYALLSGLVLVGATGLVLGPILHRMLHKFHLDDADVAKSAPAARKGRR